MAKSEEAAKLKEKKGMKEEFIEFKKYINSIE